jgi:hypothetical protein
MRRDLRLRQLLRSEMDCLTRHRLSTAERILWHGCGSDSLVLIVNVVNVRDICNVRDVRDVADIRDIDYV